MLDYQSEIKRHDNFRGKTGIVKGNEASEMSFYTDQSFPHYH